MSRPAISIVSPPTLKGLFLVSIESQVISVSISISMVGNEIL